MLALTLKRALRGIESSRVRVFGASQAPASASTFRNLDSQYMSQLAKPNGNPMYLVDTLALVKKLESEGVTVKQAEAITNVIIEVSRSFVSKSDMQKSEMMQEANLSIFKLEVQSKQDQHFSLLQLEIEKLRSEIWSMQTNMETNLEKMQTNLEKMQITIKSDIEQLQSNMDRDNHGLRARLEAAKFELIKYGFATVASISAVVGCAWHYSRMATI